MTEEKQLMKGIEAIGEAALRAGCKHYYGFPIAPQTELQEYMAKHLPERGGVFLQAENPAAAISMAYGASAGGALVLTSSSGPGISLMMEACSYLTAAELPCVLVNISRGGPGFGNIYPAQSDYWQATKGGGHGDYHLIVLAPGSVQEMADLTLLAFELAYRFRNPVMILADAALAQMMDKVYFKHAPLKPSPKKGWAVKGNSGGDQKVITSIYLNSEELEQHNRNLQKKYELISQSHTLYDLYRVEKANHLIVAFGIASQICRKAIDQFHGEGHRVGLIRPITLFPFPTQVIEDHVKKIKGLFVVEMNLGQMFQDVLLAVQGKTAVQFFGRTGGATPTVDEVVKAVKEFIRKK
ncbi:MAG: 3-methyl-2-oxobutanoate dehydrogenase subunit VorB [Thermodesulfobacteriota bacterium]